MDSNQYENTGVTLVKPINLSSQITKLLLSEIHSGTVGVGEKLPSEAELAKRYGVSRTILRESIASLKNEGILESKPGRGIVVKNIRSQQAFRFSDVFDSISINEIYYFYEMRAVIESEAASLAAIRRTENDIQAISDSFTRMEKAVNECTLGAIAHSNYNLAIANASHNPVLIEFLMFLHDKLKELAQKLRIETMISTERAHTVLEEHRRITKAILEQDSQEARDAVLTHLKNAAHRAGMRIYEL